MASGTDGPADLVCHPLPTTLELGIVNAEVREDGGDVTVLQEDGTLQSF